jgi:hypothetical protein
MLEKKQVGTHRVLEKKQEGIQSAGEEAGRNLPECWMRSR